MVGDNPYEQWSPKDKAKVSFAEYTPEFMYELFSDMPWQGPGSNKMYPCYKINGV